MVGVDLQISVDGTQTCGCLTRKDATYESQHIPLASRRLTNKNVEGCRRQLASFSDANICELFRRSPVETGASSSRQGHLLASLKDKCLKKETDVFRYSPGFL